VATGPATSSEAWKVDRFGAMKLDAPASWPVHDLSKDSHLCVRFDVNAVYLGSQGPQPDCPARLLGRTDAVQVQPLNATATENLLPAASMVNAQGQTYQVQPDSSTTRMVVAVFPKLGVVVTASFQRDPSVAQRIIDSVSGA